jgi:hypothetical protein
MTQTSDILRKVQGILAKAEATEHEAERETFLAKAQEMMEKHAITQAQLEKSKPETKREPVEVFVEWPARMVGKGAKGSMAVTIAKANRCQVKGANGWQYGQSGSGMVFQGMPDDVDFCVMLYTSLCLQAEQQYDPKQKPEWTHGKTYKASFYEGYSRRVCERLKEQAAKRKDEARSSGTDMVLVGIEKRVAEKFGRARYGSRRASDSCAAGRNDGQRAGSRADMSGGTTSRIGSRGQIGAGA